MSVAYLMEKEEKFVLNSLKQYAKIGHHHLFNGIFKAEIKYTSSTKSVCHMVDKDELIKIKLCRTFQQAREYIAQQGRIVCGVCVATFTLILKINSNHNLS